MKENDGRLKNTWSQTSKHKNFRFFWGHLSRKGSINKRKKVTKQRASGCQQRRFKQEKGDFDEMNKNMEYQLE